MANRHLGNQDSYKYQPGTFPTGTQDEKFMQFRKGGGDNSVKRCIHDSVADFTAKTETCQSGSGATVQTSFGNDEATQERITVPFRGYKIASGGGDGDSEFYVDTSIDLLPWGACATVPMVTFPATTLAQLIFSPEDKVSDVFIDPGGGPTPVSNCKILEETLDILSGAPGVPVSTGAFSLVASGSLSNASCPDSTITITLNLNGGLQCVEQTPGQTSYSIRWTASFVVNIDHPGSGLNNTFNFTGTERTMLSTIPTDDTPIVPVETIVNALNMFNLTLVDFSGTPCAALFSTAEKCAV